MVQSKEEKAIAKKASQKKWREKNKEQSKTYYEKNKVEIATYKNAYYEKNKVKIAAYKTAYNKSPAGKRTKRINSWKRQGAIGDLPKFYDERYFPATKCEVCDKEFKSTLDRHMDHCHTTGEIRWVLCHSCNNKDYWKKVLERKKDNIVI